MKNRNGGKEKERQAKGNEGSKPEEEVVAIM